MLPTPKACTRRWWSLVPRCEPSRGCSLRVRRHRLSVAKSAPTQPLYPQAQPYRRRRPENTTLHRIVREHLETYLALAAEGDPLGDGVPAHVENEFRSYLKCGILAP